MKNILIFSSLLVISLFVGSANAQNGQSLNPTEFAAKMKQLPSAPLVDVRTPGEFAQGHLKNARNIDIRSEEFEQQIAKLDKTKPVLVYCMSGGRSAAAAGAMRSMGFKEVFELSGGILKWRAANLPETTDNAVATSTGMSRSQYNALLKSDKMVLIDFYAEWCAPCRKMKPDLEAIAVEMKDKVNVIRLNADEHKALAKELNVDALPVLLLYKNQKLFWTKKGYATKAEIVKQFKK
ncbi:MAG: thioredoxin domain-containing protein [Bacteroidales bacterium]